MVHLLVFRVGIKPPGIEVRFQDIYIETSVFTNVSRNLPSILNAYRGFFEVCCDTSVYSIAFYTSLST